MFSKLDRPWFFPVLCALLLAPHFFHSPPNVPDYVAWCLPTVNSGDEPHYLVALRSLLDDGDFNLTNNYDAARRGGAQAGKRLAGQFVYHHTGYYAGDRFTGWEGVFDARSPSVDDGKSFHYLPGPEAPELSHLPEYSIHPPGLPLFLAAVLWPWRHSERLESYALFTTCIVTCLGAWFFGKLLGDFGASRSWANAVTALLYLATPAWHYGRTLYCEPYLLACATMGYYGVLGAPRFRLVAPLLGGLAVAIGLLMKPAFALLGLPLGIYLLIERRYAAAWLFGIPIVAATIATLVYQRVCFGSVWDAPQPWISGNIVTGVAGLLFDQRKGLFLLAPVVVLPLVAWPLFLKTGGPRAAVVLAGIVPYFVLIGFWKHWHSGYCYGPRLIVPLLPLMFLPLAVVTTEFIRARWLRMGSVLLVAWAFVVNLGSVLFFRLFWDGIPWRYIFG